MSFKLSPSGLDCIRHDESLVLKAYRCPANVLTIGYGHTGPDVVEGLSINREMAELLLKKDTARFAAAVNRLVTSKINQHQFDALVSFCYNVGEGEEGFGGSTLLKLINKNPTPPTTVYVRQITDKMALKAFLLTQGVTQCNLITYNFYKWVWAGGKISKGLFNRRRREAALYFKPVAS